jgi:hypothetical protein
MNTTTKNIIDHFIGFSVIVRTESAGVFFGVLKEKVGKQVILKNARRLWRWKCIDGCGISLSSLSIHGIEYDGSRVVEAVDAIWLEAIEIIPCTKTATDSITGAPNATAS